MSTISSSTIGTTDARYQRLSQEYLKLRNQVSVLKTALLEEQKKGTEQQRELVTKDTRLRKLTGENESLEFRNSALVKRIESLQSTLDEKNALVMGKGRKKHKDANLRLVGETSRQVALGTADSMCVMEQELERKLVENGELHSKLFDMEKEHEILTSRLVQRVSELEEELSRVKADYGEQASRRVNERRTKLSPGEKSNAPVMQEGRIAPGEDEALFYVAGLLGSSRIWAEKLASLLTLLEQRSLIYPFDTSMEPLPSSTKQYCDVLAICSRNLATMGEEIGKLNECCSAGDYSNFGPECEKIRKETNATLQRMKTDLLPQCVLSLREECHQPWCTDRLESLNKEWERKFYIAVDSLVGATSEALFNAETIPSTISTLHQVFRELESALREKNFIENHLPTASKKLKCINECIEKEITQLSSTLGRLHSMVSDQRATAALVELCICSPSTAGEGTSGSPNSPPPVDTLGTCGGATKGANLLDPEMNQLKERINALEAEKQEWLKASAKRPTHDCCEEMGAQTEDSSDPLEAYYAKKVKELSSANHHVLGRANYYKDECEALLKRALLDAEEKDALEQKLLELETKCESLTDVLETTRENYEAQMRGLYEHMADQSGLSAVEGHPSANRQRDLKNSSRENGGLGRR